MAQITQKKTILKSITLKPGESFTLPPNSTLVGASDGSQINNSCGTVVPTLAMNCYGVVMGAVYGSGATRVYDPVEIFGVVLDGEEIPFSDTVTLNTGTGSISTFFIGLIKEIPELSSLTDICYSQYNPNDDRGMVCALYFKAVPEIAENLLFYGVARGNTASGGNRDFRVEYPVMTPTQLKSVPAGDNVGNSTNIPVCGCANVT